ncbi:unnamed protein product [Rotaria magnacalcarata]|uniref:EF-hand domain-containing protein n=2 Tax=Rotaria magnacalcarata TaxID=392030 RepID=A0A8S2PSM8_9BILA|nr:unnamed protein product [Rotaria magnacalcarata]CAF4066194.1 unnamed protein product [Rotaria magnacalcarata]
MAHLTLSQEREMHESFDLFDADHSSSISKSELKHVTNALNIKVNEHEFEKLLSQFNTDHCVKLILMSLKQLWMHPILKNIPNKNYQMNSIIYYHAWEGTEIEAIVKSLDTDSGGKISFEKFSQIFYSFFDRMAKLTASQERELHDAFDLFDTDHSGKISKSELKHVLNALHIKANEHELTQLLSQMDADHSGEVDFNEFKTVMGASYFKKCSTQELHAAFKKFDEDGNGYITGNELDHILSRMGRHLSRTEIEAIVKSLDKSGDGKISFDEFCKLFD